MITYDAQYVLDRCSNTEDASACWEWQKCKRGGYGRITISGVATVTVHRYLWELVNGSIPVGLNVLHRCDNPPCCNLSHLYLGTQADNVLECEVKERGNHPKGVQHGRAKLTEDAVREIRALKASGAKSIELARKYGVSDFVISQIVKNRLWTHV